MKIFTKLFLSFILYTASAIAQDTIRTQDMPAAGTNYTMSIGQTFPGIDYSSTGANYAWDFTQLGRTGQRIDSILDPANTNPLLNFFFINIPLNTNRANLAQSGGNFNLGTTGLTNVYNYYYNSINSFAQPGFGAVVSGLPIPVPFTPHDVIYKFPLAFGDEDSVSYSYELDLSTTVGIYYQVDRKRHNLVDGWGTLSTPFGNFSALRVISTIVEQDSFYVDTFGLGVNLPPVTTYEYKWLSPGMGLPLLQINVSAANQITQIIYQDSTRTIGIDEIATKVSDVTVFPNPASELLFIKYDVMQKGEITFEFFSSNGKLIFSEKENALQGENFRRFDLKNFELSSGSYFFKLRTGNTEIVKQVQVR